MTAGCCAAFFNTRYCTINSSSPNSADALLQVKAFRIAPVELFLHALAHVAYVFRERFAIYPVAQGLRANAAELAVEWSTLPATGRARNNAWCSQVHAFSS